MTNSRPSLDKSHERETRALDKLIKTQKEELGIVVKTSPELLDLTELDKKTLEHNYTETYTEIMTRKPTNKSRFTLINLSSAWDPLFKTSKSPINNMDILAGYINACHNTCKVSMLRAQENGLITSQLKVKPNFNSAEAYMSYYAGVEAEYRGKIRAGTASSEFDKTISGIAKAKIRFEDLLDIDVTDKLRAHCRIMVDCKKWNRTETAVSLLRKIRYMIYYIVQRDPALKEGGRIQITALNKLENEFSKMFMPPSPPRIELTISLGHIILAIKQCIEDTDFASPDELRKAIMAVSQIQGWRLGMIMKFYMTTDREVEKDGLPHVNDNHILRKKEGGFPDPDAPIYKIEGRWTVTRLPGVDKNLEGPNITEIKFFSSHCSEVLEAYRKLVESGRAEPSVFGYNDGKMNITKASNLASRCMKAYIVGRFGHRLVRRKIVDTNLAFASEKVKILKRLAEAMQHSYKIQQTVYASQEIMAQERDEMLDWAESTAYVGMRVCKMFDDHKIYIGSVESRDHDKVKGMWMYQILYDDGEVARMTLEEVRRHLVDSDSERLVVD